MQTRLLAKHEDFGSVTRCENGCLYVQLGFTVMTLTEPQFMQLVTMVADSAAYLEQIRAPANSGGRG